MCLEKVSHTILELDEEPRTRQQSAMSKTVKP